MPKKQTLLKAPTVEEHIAAKKEIQELRKQVKAAYKETNRVQKEKEKLVKSIKKRQFITKKKKPAYINITDRAVHHGYISKEDAQAVSKMYTIKINGRDCDLLHPDHMKFKSQLAKMSTKMSSAKKKIDDEYPELKRGNRTNGYLLGDYEKFGDAILKDHFVKQPPNTWQINWDWEAPPANLSIWCFGDEVVCKIEPSEGKPTPSEPRNRQEPSAPASACPPDATQELAPLLASLELAPPAVEEPQKA